MFVLNFSGQHVAPFIGLSYDDSNRTIAFAPIFYPGVPSTSGDTMPKFLSVFSSNEHDYARKFLSCGPDSKLGIARIFLSDGIGNTAGTVLPRSRSAYNIFGNCYFAELSCDMTGIPAT